MSVNQLLKTTNVPPWTKLNVVSVQADNINVSGTLIANELIQSGPNNAHQLHKIAISSDIPNTNDILFFDGSVLDYRPEASTSKFGPEVVSVGVNSGDFNTISEGVAYANTNFPSDTPVVVLVQPGVYNDELNPIIVNKNVEVSGMAGHNNEIRGSDVSREIFNTKGRLGYLNLFGQGIKIDNTASDEVFLVNVNTHDAPIGIECINAKNITTAHFSVENTSIAGKTGVSLDASNILLHDSRLRYCDYGVIVNNDSAARGDAFFVLDSGVAAITLGSDQTNDIEFTSLVIRRSSDAHLQINTTSDAIINIINTELDKEKINNLNNRNVEMMFYNLGEGVSQDKGINIYSELNVGNYNKPVESVFGGGDSYTKTMKVLTNTNLAAGAFNDITDALQAETTTNLFASDITDNTCYIGGDLEFYGIKIDQITALNSDHFERIEVSQFTSDGWLNINHMSTNSNTHQNYSNKILSQANNSTQIRFRNRSNLAKSVLNGENKYWTRLRITSDIPSTPSSSHIKLHSSRYEINADGFVEYFGNSRPIADIPIHLSNFNESSLASKTTSQDLFLSQVLYAGLKFNSFAGNKDSTLGNAFIVPNNLDTSIPVQVSLTFTVDNSLAGFVEIQNNIGVSNGGDAVFLTQGVAPSDTIHSHLTTSLISIGTGEQHTQKSLKVNLNLHDIDVNDSVFWYSIVRNAFSGSASDNYIGDFNLISCNMRYAKYREGDHLSLGIIEDYVVD